MTAAKPRPARRFTPELGAAALRATEGDIDPIPFLGYSRARISAICPQNQNYSRG
ncbi:hypothetical protein [Sphingomonas sp.]|uniref:hypothetical protein n=1 Tax=Sphingomonas sp. TaxID=28214 RepID=UPI0025F3DE77|nr:hypothetical protein [Sphingomonas sp.]